MRGYDCAGEGSVGGARTTGVRSLSLQNLFTLFGTKPPFFSMLSVLLFLSSFLLLFLSSSSHVRGGLLSLEPGAITRSDCKQITPANKDIYWSSMEIAKGGTIEGMSKWFYLCDEWKYTDVIKYYLTCAAELDALTEKAGPLSGKSLANLAASADRVNIGDFVVLPIPVRRCGKGWTLVGKPSSAKAYCARTDGGQKSTEPATCYGGMCSEYHLELEVRRLRRVYRWRLFGAQWRRGGVGIKIESETEV